MRKKRQYPPGIYRRGEIFWIRFWVPRKGEVRESTRSTKLKDAQALLRERARHVHRYGVTAIDERKFTLREAFELMKADYEKQAHRSTDTARHQYDHLADFFGAETALVQIDKARVDDYGNHRHRQGVENSTINRELARLNRLFTLASEKEKITTQRRFKPFGVERIREGFVEDSDFDSLVLNLPDHVRGVVRFLYLSGWRKNEALSLEWRDVSMTQRLIALRAGNSKTGQGRVLPLSGEIWDVIQEAHGKRRLECSFVFHRNGKRIRGFRKSWNTACKAIGREELLVHDLRRSAARNLINAGVDESTAMKFTGHKTRSMFHRYNIRSIKDMERANAKMEEYRKQQEAGKVVPFPG